MGEPTSERELRCARSECPTSLTLAVGSDNRLWRALDLWQRATLPLTRVHSELDFDASSAMAAKAGTGRIPAIAIQALIRKHIVQIQKCYEAGLARLATLEGRVIVRFVIERDGTVSRVEVDPSSTMPDAEVSRCVSELISSLEFAEPNGGSVSVTYRIVFQPRERTAR